MESEDSTRFTDSLGQDPTTPGLEVSKDLAMPSELEEPINLSVKKPPLVPAVNTSMALQQYRNPKGEAQVSKQPVVHVGHRHELSTSRSDAGQETGLRWEGAALSSRTDLLGPVLFPSLWPGHRYNISIQIVLDVWVGGRGNRKNSSQRH